MTETLVETLRADGRLERTWLIFTSDNGLALGEHRVDSKRCVYEECVRVPLVIIPPAAAARRTDDRLVANIDLASTILEIQGAASGGLLDGHSLLPLLDGAATDWREGIVLEAWPDQHADGFQGVRTAQWKYLRHPTGEEELYDAHTDPHELQNLAADPAFADQKQRLIELLESLLAS